MTRLHSGLKPTNTRLNKISGTACFAVHFRTVSLEVDYTEDLSLILRENKEKRSLHP
jgi:hypothetical protein